MNKYLKWGLVGLVVAGIAIWGWYGLTPHQNKEMNAAPSAGQPKKALAVNARVLKPHLITDQILVTGKLLPDEEVDLAFETSGKITALYFNEGSVVQKGTLLGKVNDEHLQAQLKRLEAQLPLAEARVYRQATLLNREAVSQEALEQVRTELATLKAEIENVKANIRMTELRAPFDGVIGLRQLSAGAYASPSSVVAKLTKMNPLKVEFSVPERYAQEVRKGTNLDFKVDGYLDPFQAQVYATESALDIGTHTLTVRALYPNASHELQPGRYTDIALKNKEIEDAIAVPSQAIVPEMGINKVFVYHNGKAEPVDVETGIRTASEVQILRGLQEGDTIITSGTLQLRKDLDVKLQKID